MSEVGRLLILIIASVSVGLAVWPPMHDRAALALGLAVFLFGIIIIETLRENRP